MNADKKWLRVVIKYLMLLQPLVWMTMQGMCRTWHKLDRPLLSSSYLLLFIIQRALGHGIL